ncbi:MAG: ZIP family metal transporter [Solirubrobacterales bacterium]
MAEAGLWGALGASSLFLGAVLGLALPIPKRVIGLVLGFGAGTLISALTFELTEEAFRLGGADAVALGLAAGALTYFFGDLLIERRGAQNRMSSTGEQAGGSASALLLGAVLDGIPESAVIGITLLEGSTVGVAVLAAVFLSNLPESLSASTGMKSSGSSTGHVLAVWGMVVVVAAVSAALGYGLLDGASGNTIGFIQAFAGGAVLTMLVDTMIPEAYKRGGNLVGLVTVLGFALAYLLSTLE